MNYRDMEEKYYRKFSNSHRYDFISFKKHTKKIISDLCDKLNMKVEYYNIEKLDQDMWRCSDSDTYEHCMIEFEGIVYDIVEENYSYEDNTERNILKMYADILKLGKLNEIEENILAKRIYIINIFQTDDEYYLIEIQYYINNETGRTERHMPCRLNSKYLILDQRDEFLSFIEQFSEWKLNYQEYLALPNIIF